MQPMRTADNKKGSLGCLLVGRYAFCASGGAVLCSPGDINVRTSMYVPQGLSARPPFNQLARWTLPYFWRKRSTRPAVSTIFCLPV